MRTAGFEAPNANCMPLEIVKFLNKSTNNPVQSLRNQRHLRSICAALILYDWAGNLANANWINGRVTLTKGCKLLIVSALWMVAVAQW